jgi:hypothetical protein
LAFKVEREKKKKNSKMRLAVDKPLFQLNLTLKRKVFSYQTLRTISIGYLRN